MKVMVTGANGFIGKNLISYLKTTDDISIVPVYRENFEKTITNELPNVDWIIHLAAVLRPEQEDDFESINLGLTKFLLESMVKVNHFPRIIFTSSVHTHNHNLYGITKLSAEKMIEDYSLKFNFDFYIYRLTNIFGKWNKPNYNSVVATFCHNIANNLPIRIFDGQSVLSLSYIDDVIDAFYRNLTDNKMQNIQSYPITIYELAD